MIGSTAGTDGRLARAVLQVYNARDGMSAAAAPQWGEVLLAARSMDFAERLRSHPKHQVSGALAEHYGRQVGIDPMTLRSTWLPLLKGAGVVDFTIQGSTLVTVEEFVGLSAPFLDQVEATLAACSPPEEQLTALESIQLGTLAPLAARDHKHKLSVGHSDDVVERGVQLALASGVMRSVASAPLGEVVYYNPAVWGSESVDVAAFLRGLPSAERDALLAVVDVTSQRRGIALPSAALPEGILKGARRVGLVQATSVRSTAVGANGSQTYLFPPLNVIEDGARGVTEALHERKLVAAHFMFGHEKARQGLGRIANPVILVNSLLNKGYVGPATNIGTDYHLLEAAGIVTVDPGTSRPYLRLIKEDIVRDALGWLRQIYDDDTSQGGRLVLNASPSTFVTPEVDSNRLAVDDAANEVANSAILALREEIARNVRGERA